MTEIIAAIEQPLPESPSHLDDFTRGYIEALLFTEGGPDNPEFEDKTFYDLSKMALRSIISDCEKFQKDNDALLQEAYLLPDDEGFDSNQAGICFWLSRNGHGAGFFDYGLHTLQDACGWRTPFPEVSPVIGDDGKIYLY